MIRLVSLNVERSKHLDLVIPFLEKQQADVVCLQELMEKDIAAISSSLGNPSVHFTLMTTIIGEGRSGTGIFSRLPIEDSGMEYYVGGDGSQQQDVNDRSTFNNAERAFSWCDVAQSGATHRIGTTHFTWTPDGLPSEEQRMHMRELLSTLSRHREFILCGDFNAPRGGEIFAMLAQKYKDNIPSKYRTSIDVDLHRAGKIASKKMDEKMVDGLFSTPGYVVSDVELHAGVSDHMAITASIAKAESA